MRGSVGARGRDSPGRLDLVVAGVVDLDRRAVREPIAADVVVVGARVLVRAFQEESVLVTPEGLCSKRLWLDPKTGTA
jgi:hypothetical protein